MGCTILWLHSPRAPFLCTSPHSRRMVHSKETEHVNQNENTECHQIYTRKKGNPEGCYKGRFIMIPNQFESIWTCLNKLCEPVP